MAASTSNPAYQDRTGWFKVSGVLLLVSGIAVGLLIPLGYGHLKMRRWVRPLTLALLGAWLVVGALLSAVAAFILAASKDLSLPAVLAVLALLGLSYLVAPGLLIRSAGLACITWGTLQRRPWAWWGSVILLGLFTCSTVLTFCRASYSAILAGLAFPPRELEILGNVPAQGYHFALLVGLPLLITWGVALLSKRHFRHE